MYTMQELLNKQTKDDSAELRQAIRAVRGDKPPVCWSEDDCSTLFLSTCPWRIDCGSKESVRWYMTGKYEITDLNL